MPVDLVAVINEVFDLTPPLVEAHVSDDPLEQLWHWEGAKDQYERIRPLVMKMARALEELLTRNEAQSALLAEAEAINDRYDEILKSLLEEKS